MMNMVFFYCLSLFAADYRGNKMSFLEILTIAAALSMDALAVSVAGGFAAPSIPARNCFAVAAFFGIFQALMPLLGWGLGKVACGIIGAYDHWIAFIILVAIGAKMIFDSLKVKEGDPSESEGSFAYPLNYSALLLLSVATSIDALAAGVSFSCISMPVLPACAIIGTTTFALSFLGVKFGRKMGRKLGNKFTFLGGLAIIAVGARIAFAD